MMGDHTHRFSDPGHKHSDSGHQHPYWDAGGKINKTYFNHILIFLYRLTSNISTNHKNYLI